MCQAKNEKCDARHMSNHLQHYQIFQLEKSITKTYTMRRKKKDYLKKDSSKPTQVLKSQAMKPYWRFKTQIRDSK